MELSVAVGHGKARATTAPNVDDEPDAVAYDVSLTSASRFDPNHVHCRKLKRVADRFARRALLDLGT